MNRVVIFVALVFPLLGVAEKFRCGSTEGDKASVTLDFDKGDFEKMTFNNLPFKKAPAKITRRAKDTKPTIGRNSADEYTYYEWPLQMGSDSWTIQMSYKTKHEGKALLLTESLVGTYDAVNGKPYGKLRVDVTLGPDNDYGSSFFFKCKEQEK